MDSTFNMNEDWL